MRTKGDWTECEWEFSDCERRAKVNVGEFKYCIKHYNENRRRKRQAIKRQGDGEVEYASYEDLRHLEWVSQDLVNKLEETWIRQCQCTTLSCSVRWRKVLADTRAELNKVLLEISKLEELPIMAREKYFQERVRKELKRIGWHTYKTVGNVSLPGMPDVLGRSKWGGIALIEFKGGTPLTEQEALFMLKGAQRSVLTDLAYTGAPAIICVGDLDKGTIVELSGLLDKNKCGILHYVHVAEVACQIEGWLRAWIREAPTKWGREVDQYE